MGISKNLLLITSIFVQSAISLTVVYKFSFEDFEKCLQKQQQEYNCNQYESFETKLDCIAYVMKIQSSLSIDKASQKGIDIFLPFQEKTIDFQKRIRNLPYSLEEHFEDTLKLAEGNKIFYEEIFTPTYLFCLK